MCICCVIAIHKTLSSVLQLGNIQFFQDKTSEQASLPDNTGNDGDVHSVYVVLFFVFISVAYCDLILVVGNWKGIRLVKIASIIQKKNF